MTGKEKQFCYYYAKLQNPKEAAIKAGYYPITAEKSGTRLLAKQEILKRITQYEEEEKQSRLQKQLLSGILRLCFGSVNDAVKLALRHDQLSDEQVDCLDLFSISELKKQKDGGFEVKFFNRLDALDRLQKMAGMQEQNEGAGEFYKVLQSSAKAIAAEEKGIGKGDRNETI